MYLETDNSDRITHAHTHARMHARTHACMHACTHTCRPVDGTPMNEECEAVMVDHQVCAVRFLTWEDVAPRRPTSPTKHTQNPMARKIRDDWWVRPSHGECHGSAKANEPCLPTHTHTHTRTHTWQAAIWKYSSEKLYFGLQQEKNQIWPLYFLWFYTYICNILQIYSIQQILGMYQIWSA